MITESDSSTDASCEHHRGASGWRLCTVQQVEDLKSLLAVLPLWSFGILVSMSIGVMSGMLILQALSMDRSLGPRFKILAGSITVSSMIAFIAVTPILERAMFPLWRKVTGSLLTPL
jgi:solute carrier family 15 (peptide/histidine transporter), member 3/4